MKGVMGRADKGMRPPCFPRAICIAQNQARGTDLHASRGLWIDFSVEFDRIYIVSR